MTSCIKQTFRIARFCMLTAFCFVHIMAGAALAQSGAQDEQPILVFGHMNPDTDAVVSSIAAAHLLSLRGKPAVPMLQGAPVAETAFVLKKFDLQAPERLQGIAKRRIAITDFTEPTQGPADMQEASLVFIADHHKLGGLTSPDQLEAWIQPVGSACTVLYEAYGFYSLDIPKNLAGAMLSAILSDTVSFKSPTTTERDKAAAAKLANIAGVTDIKALGIELFSIKSAIDKLSAKELVLGDYKAYTMNGKKVGVGQIEVLDMAQVNGRKKELLAAMAELKKEQGLNSVFLMLTDIMQEGTLLLAFAEDQELVKKVFSQNLTDSEVWLPGVMSRKKQIIPGLESALNR